MTPTTNTTDHALSLAKEAAYATEDFLRIALGHATAVESIIILALIAEQTALADRIKLLHYAILAKGEKS